MGKTMHALPVSTVGPLCWTISLNAFCGRGLQKGLLSLKNNMLITTHCTERREHAGVRNRCLIHRSSPGLSSHVVQWPEHGESGLLSGFLSCWNVHLGFHIRVCFNHLTIFATWVLWLQPLNIHDVKWSGSAQSLLGYLLWGWMHWKKFTKSGTLIRRW